MAPGIFRLRTACFTLVIPIRLAICLPLLICTLDAYSPHAALVPQGSLPPLTVTVPRPASGPGSTGSGSALPEDAHGGPVYEYEKAYITTLRPDEHASSSSSGSTSSPHLGRTLALSFVLAAAALSVFGILAFSWLGDVEEGDGSQKQDEATLVEGGGGYDDGESGSESERGASATRRRLRLGILSLGIATRLLLGALGATAMARVIGDRSAMKRGSFIAVEVLGWLLVAVLYCGAFHRILCLLRGSGALRRGGKEVLTGSLVGKRGREETLEPASIGDQEMKNHMSGSFL